MEWIYLFPNMTHIFCCIFDAFVLGSDITTVDSKWTLPYDNYVHETAVMGFLIGSYGIINYITAVIYLFALIKIYFIYELHCCDECVQKN